MSASLAARIAEAVLFAAEAPVAEAELRARLPEGCDLGRALDELRAAYAGRGVVLERHGGAWAFRTAPDLEPYLERRVVRERRPTRAALETLAVVAYHQPATRAEIEAVRGVAVARGTLDVLLEAGWIRPKGRRDAPGRPVTWVTTDAFLDHFALESLDDLPRRDEVDRLGLDAPPPDDD